MKLDVSVELKARDGSSMKFGEAIMTVRLAIVTALDSPLPNQTLKGEEKLKRFKLGERIYEAKNIVELSLEEAVLIKQLVDEAWPSPLIVAPIWCMLEGKEDGDKLRSNGVSAKRVSDVAPGVPDR